MLELPTSVAISAAILAASVLCPDNMNFSSVTLTGVSSAYVHLLIPQCMHTSQCATKDLANLAIGSRNVNISSHEPNLDFLCCQVFQYVAN